MSTLAALLDEGAAFDAEYGDGLSNHLPMALLSLQRLGAGEARLDAFGQAYRPRLGPAPPPVPWPAGDAWPSRLGERAAWPRYRELFAQWLAHESAADVLAQVLPQLMQGVGAAAFHGLLRTSSALQSGHERELADALAYWACRWLDLGHSRARGRAADPARLLPRLPVAASGARLIFERMAAAAAAPAFVQTVAQLRVDAGTLQRLAELAATLYARSGDFTALHLVTSAHAMRVLLPFMEEPLPALRAYWRAFAAGVAATDLEPGEPTPPQPWDRIVGFALSSDDEHVIKLVHACREETAAYGGDAWQRAASRLLRRG